MKVLYLGRQGDLGQVDDSRLDATTERHKLDLKVQPHAWQGPPLEALDRDSELQGLIMEMEFGFVGRNRLRLSKQLLAKGRRAWVHWPAEEAVECIGVERLDSLWRHWYFVKFARYAFRVSLFSSRLRALLREVPIWRLPMWAMRRLLGSPPPGERPPDQLWHLRPVHERLNELDRRMDAVKPVPFTLAIPSRASRVPGCGVYLRTDFWTRIDSGGSYGHTCYVAKELAAVSDRFVCFMPSRYQLLDDYGLTQVIIEPSLISGAEDTIVDATQYYVRMLRPAFQALQPKFLYERLCLGNYAGAVLSRELDIPYIVEYNGSEISMRRSFDGSGYLYENEYLKAEMVAFRQATMISVVSEEVRNDLLKRGVDPEKILVNPNGADLDAYAPPSPSERAAVRSAVGFSDQDIVVGFTGTFGGWHGIDVLAAALPRIAAAVPSAKFLLIGDGNYKHLVDDAVAQHSLQNRVHFAGRVPQADGARLLKAIDIFVSPHSSHMVDSKFFGSPTKIFEYMSLGGAIVASDLEQIGQILSPALRVADLENPAADGDGARSVLCTPGDVAEFVSAVVALAGRRDLWPSLGRHARRAVEQDYSWERHVARLWPFVLSLRPAPPPIMEPGELPRSATGKIVTGDKYKDEVQRQWDNDPAGSHYVTNATRHTLDWFLEAEAYRYGVYGPWMPEVMEFAGHSGETVLELGGGMGTDLSQFARHGALTTDLDLSAGHLALAKENFHWRNLPGRFIHHDAEILPFDDNTFDLVYSNGVIHHTPNTRSVVGEIKRVLKPGGKAIVMVYAENSLHYWRNLVWAIGIKERKIDLQSMGEIMSRAVERSDNASARPLVKVYTPERLRELFTGFESIEIVQRQMLPEEKPRMLARLPTRVLEHRAGWNLIIKARKPAR